MRSALTPEQKKEVIRLHTSGRYTYKELSQKYYVSVSTLRRIVGNVSMSEIKKFGGYYRKPIRNKTPMRKRFDRRKVVKHLIEAVSEYALMDNWTECYLMEILLSCGLIREDFEEAGYLDFYNEYFEEAV